MKLLLAIFLLVVSCGKPTDPLPTPPIPIDPCERSNAGPNKTITKGQRVEIGLNNFVAGVSYNWIPEGSVMSSRSPRTFVAPLVSTVYLLKVKNSCGVSYSTVKVKVL